MSSKHKQSRPKKKKDKSEKHREPFFKKRRRRKILYNVPTLTYPSVSQYKKDQPIQIEGANIKNYFKSLEKDIKLYKEFKEEYTKGKLVDNVMSQINEDFKIIEKELSESNLPTEKLTELQKEYETIKSKYIKII